MLIFSGSSNPVLAKKVAQELGCRNGRVLLSSFPNSETRVRIMEKNINSEVVLLQSFSNPADKNIIEFCLLADALKRLGAKKIVAVIPWMGYCIQDKVFLPGEPLSARVIANLIQACKIDSIIMVDLHNEAIEGFFDLPLSVLSAMPLFEDLFKKKDKIDVLVSPDVGALKKTTRFAEKLKLPIVTINKKRELVSGRTKIIGIEGKLEGKKALIIDDFISTGETLIQTAKYLKAQKVQKVIVAVTHHLFIKGTQKKLEKSPIDKIYISDTVMNPEKTSKQLEIVSVNKIIAQAISKVA